MMSDQTHDEMWDELQSRIDELEAFLLNRTHICSGRDCVGIYAEPTGSLPRCEDCRKVAAIGFEYQEE
jgi:hypothetical protein